MIYFPFCIHNHQPVGNFSKVLEDAYNRSYLPFLKTLSKYPSIKLTLHTTGFLLDWLCENRREYIDLMRQMASRGQVEVMGGGYYEPILSVIPEADRVGQIRLMSDKIEELFGGRPRGLWLAERVWEPSLPTTLKNAGIDYILVDDYHFIKSGLTREELGGYYITEDQGNIIKVFPGSERLRYLIPFQPVETLEDHLKGLEGFLKKGNAAIYGDDGEKFGVWPGTHKHVFDDGWLERFFEKIESLHWLRPVTLGEYTECEKPLGRVYLPTTSYMEMGEWSLPAQSHERYSRLLEDIKGWHDGDRVRQFLQGGTWRNFFAKYPEANWMHKRMLMASRAVSSARASGGLPQRSIAEAERHLYKAQCNDAYWHGIFGGLYLPHLRSAVYENLIKAETLYLAGAQATVQTLDMDADGCEEAVIRTGGLNIFLSPCEGGALYELDYKPAALNLSNTLSRWNEGYHHKLKARSAHSGDSGARSIHDMVLVKEEGLEKLLVTDTRRRGSFIDHFIRDNVTLDEFAEGRVQGKDDFGAGAYELHVEDGGDDTAVTLSRWGDVGGTGVFVIKTVRPIGANSFAVDYRIENNVVEDEHVNPDRYLFAVEFNVILPCCDGPVCQYRFEPPIPGLMDIGLGSRGELREVQTAKVVDELRGVQLRIDISGPAALWRFPVHTVSLSEAGFEKIYQGSCLVFLVPVDLAAFGGTELGFSVTVGGIEG